MDQAASLRKLMNKKEENKKNVISFLNVGENENVEQFIFKFSEYTSKIENGKYVLFGIEKEKNTLKRYIDGKINKNDFLIENGEDLNIINGRLNFINDIRFEKEKVEKLIEIIREQEKRDNLIFYSGESTDLSAINLSLNTNKIILIVDEKEKTEQELINVFKILEKLNPNCEIGIIVNTFDQLNYERKIEFCKEVNQYNDLKIVGVGFFENKYLEFMPAEKIFYNFNMNFMLKKNTSKKLSITLDNMLN